MDMVTRGQTLDKAVCISRCTNTKGTKDMNPTILPPTRGQTELLYQGYHTKVKTLVW